MAKLNPKIKLGDAEASTGEVGGTWEKKVTMRDTEKRYFGYVQQMRRVSFFKANTLDLGHGLKDSYTIYTSEGVYFNMPVQVIQ